MYRRILSIKFILFVLIFFSFSSVFAEDDFRDSDNPFGVLEFLIWNHPWNTYHYDSLEKVERAVVMMKEAGVGFVRMDFLWYDLEPEPGVFEFKRYDRIVDVLQKNDIRILGILEYNPAWHDGPWNEAPDFDLYEKFVSRVVNHFKDRVKYWEIWNEPDEETYWIPQDEMKTYTELLKRIYPVIKKIDPTCKVLMGGVSRMPNISLKRIYQNGGRDYFDIVNIHPFVDPLATNAIKIVKGIYTSVCKVMRKYGDENKRIWFTELGCPGVKEVGPENNWWQGISPTEEQQAAWVKQIYTECLNWEGVDKVFWAFFRDTNNHFKTGVDYFGLIRNDFTQKSAYKAYKEISKKVLASTF